MNGNKNFNVLVDVECMCFMFIFVYYYWLFDDVYFLNRNKYYFIVFDFNVIEEYVDDVRFMIILYVKK